MDVSEVWRRNHPWAPVYSKGINTPWIAKPVARLMWGTDLGLLYKATAAIGDMPAGSRILDVPCGSGVALRGLRPGQGTEYVAADIAPAMLERTQETAHKLGVADQVETMEADVQALPFEDGEFDLVCSFTGLHCFPNPRDAVMELARVTKPGGRISLSWLRNDAGLVYKPGFIAAQATGLIGDSAGVDEVQGWLGIAGFVDVDLTTSGALAYVSAMAG